MEGICFCYQRALRDWMNAAVTAYVFNFLHSMNTVSIYLSSYIYIYMYIHFTFVNSIYFFLWSILFRLDTRFPLLLFLVASLPTSLVLIQVELKLQQKVISPCGCLKQISFWLPVARCSGVPAWLLVLDVIAAAASQLHSAPPPPVRDQVWGPCCQTSQVVLSGQHT